jgi:O-antigen ligase
VTAGARLGLRLTAIPVAALFAYAVAQAASAPTAAEGFERAMWVIVVGGVTVAALALRPAWAISGALALSMFQSHWDLLGAPFSVDRYATLLAIGSTLVREWRHRDGRLQTRPIDWLLIVTALYALCSAQIIGALAYEDPKFELLDRFGLIPFALFFVAPLAFRTEADRRVLMGTLVAVGTYLGVTAVLETIGAKPLIVPQYINDPTVGIHSDRARGPFLEAGANGLILYACAVAAVIAFIKWRDPRARKFALFVAGLCLLGVILALTRVVWIGAAVATPLALLAAREMRRFVVPAVLVGALIWLVALATIPGLQARVDERKNDNKQTVWSRKSSNAAALRMVDDKPLLGHGWGTFQTNSVSYYRQAQDYPMTFVPSNNLHNVYLQNAVELGLVGTALWALALLAAIVGGVLRRGPPELRPWKIGLVAVALAQLIAWATVPAEYVMPTLLLWLWAGVAWGPTYRPPDDAGSAKMAR